MTIKSVVVSILCIMIAGCASLTSVEDNQTERQAIDIYDSQGNVKERMIIKDDYITIYDKDWKTKGYGKVQKQLEYKNYPNLLQLVREIPGGQNLLIQTKIKDINLLKFLVKNPACNELARELQFCRMIFRR